jgi:hypothetical protein
VLTGSFLPDHLISPAEIERAVYLDFEGFVESPPSLAGLRCEDDFHQIVFDDALEPAAAAKGLQLAFLDDFLCELLERCRREDRRLVAITQHEKAVAALWADVDFTSVYCDGRKVAKRWVNRAGRGAELEDWSLKSFLRFILVERPAHLGTRQATKRLGYVRAMLIKRGRYESLTPTAKGKWTKLLAHNKIDCDGLRALMMLTAID